MGSNKGLARKVRRATASLSPDISCMTPMRTQVQASHAGAQPPPPAMAQPPGAAAAPGPMSPNPAADPHLAAGIALMEHAEWGLAGGRFGDALRAGPGSAWRAAQYLAAVKMLQAWLEEPRTAP